MRAYLKAIIVIISILILLLVVDYSSTLNYTANKETTEQTAVTGGEYPENDAFIPETHGYEDKIIFTYVLRNSEVISDYYTTYEIKENENTIESENNTLYENVSFENPIVIEIPRKLSSVYELEMIITDEKGNKVHQSGITIESKYIKGRS